MNILFAWEMGSNYGHLARCLPVAERLRAKGHRVAFAVRDLRTAGQLLGQRFPFLQAPLPPRCPPRPGMPASFAEILLADGWRDPLGHGSQILAWRYLLTLAAPDRIIADHAPTALLAARSLGLPTIPFGSGFEIPRVDSDLRSIRPWEPIATERLDAAEAEITDRANDALGAFDCQPIMRLADLFAPRPLLATFPELDHFGERPDATYLGAIYGLAAARDAQQPARHKGKNFRVFAYLRAEHAVTAEVIAALDMTGVSTLCVVPDAGMHAHDVGVGVGENVCLLRGPADVDAALRTADLVVSYGGAGMVAQALRAGVPMLLIPQFAEQRLGARCVDNLGAGMVLGEERSRDAIATAVLHLLDDTDRRCAARAFSAKYSEWTPQRAASLAASAITETQP